MQYLVWSPSLGQTFDNAKIMYVNGNAQSAAEEWARTRDISVDYEVANGGSLDVSVWDGQRKTKWKVTGEMRPVYFAQATTPIPKVTP